MDRTPPSEGGDVGSIPTESTKKSRRFFGAREKPPARLRAGIETRNIAAPYLALTNLQFVGGTGLEPVTPPV